MLIFKLFKFVMILVVSSFLLASAPAFAADAEDEPEAEAELDALKIYDVEVIIFKNISVPKDDEINLPTPSPLRSHKTLDLSDPASVLNASQKGFSLLTVDELRLSGVVQSILKSSRYELLTHTGWRQPGLDTENSFPVWIKGGDIYGVDYSSIDQSSTELQYSDGSGQNASAQERGAASTQKGLYELEGQIIITLSRYLHTQANLVLRKPLESGSSTAASRFSGTTGPNVTQGRMLYNYGLNEKRRMRSKKLHYLDHPQFGMLVLITPYQKPAEAAPPQIPEELVQNAAAITTE